MESKQLKAVALVQQIFERKKTWVLEYWPTDSFNFSLWFTFTLSEILLFYLFLQYCCEACKVGIIAGSMSMCNLKTFKFDPPWDQIYKSCCEEPIRGPDNPLPGDIYLNIRNIIYFISCLTEFSLSCFTLSFLFSLFNFFSY